MHAIRAAAFLTAAPLALMASLAAAQDGPARLEPLAIGQIYCLALRGNDMAPVQALLTPALAGVIAEAEARNDAIQKQFPEDKPPLGDGIPWQSWPDYPDRCEATIEGQPPGRVGIRLGFGQPESDSFIDQLVLVELPSPLGTGPTWRIDDVDYVMGGTLREYLAEAFGP